MTFNTSQEKGNREGGDEEGQPEGPQVSTSMQHPGGFIHCWHSVVCVHMHTFMCNCALVHLCVCECI